MQHKNLLNWFYILKIYATSTFGVVSMHCYHDERKICVMANVKYPTTLVSISGISVLVC